MLITVILHAFMVHYLLNIKLFTHCFDHWLENIQLKWFPVNWLFGKLVPLLSKSVPNAFHKTTLLFQYLVWLLIFFGCHPFPQFTIY